MHRSYGLACDDSRGVTVASEPLAATFLPELGHARACRSAIAARSSWRSPAGSTATGPATVTGLPAAGALGQPARRARRYEVEGVVVDLDGPRPPHRRPTASPSTARCRPSPAGRSSSRDERSFAARFDFGARPDLLASFPFPHELRSRRRRSTPATPARWRRRSRRRPTGRFPSRSATTRTSACPGSRGSDVRLRLPARRHLALDDRRASDGRGPHRGAPRTSRSGRAPSTTSTQLDDDRRAGLTGGGRRLALELGDGLPATPRCSPRPPPTASASNR